VTVKDNLTYAWAAQPWCVGDTVHTVGAMWYRGYDEKMIFLVSSLCFYSRQSFEVFIFCTPQF